MTKVQKEKKSISAKEKRTLVQKYYAKLVSKQEILDDYGINERTLRRWCWWYEELIQKKYKIRPKMKKSDLPDDPKALKKLIMEIQREKENAELKAEAMEIIVDIASESTGINFKKKVGGKRSTK
ncbi:hypothetical protein [Persicobacter diffluens]|uniref:Transposase n=1 Tax=Persicobacter diffluens TaxID=981 RepID=A0AAN4VVS0_9BACT|nr:hypothetical protein PEDI_15560 [Persicobacter diffluens]